MDNPRQILRDRIRDRSLRRFKRFALFLIFVNTTILVLCLSSLGVDESSENFDKSFRERFEEITKEVLQKRKKPGVDHVAKQREILTKRRSPPIFNGPQNDRQRQIVEAFLHGWKGYRRFAWGKDELKPVFKSFGDEYGLGLTIMDSLDTAIIMGLDNEVKASIDWLENDFYLKDTYVNTFETTIRVLGGLLSAYHLTGEPVFQKHANIFGDALLSAWNYTKIPLNRVNLLHKKGANFLPYSNLAEVGSFQLEFRDLAEVTMDDRYMEVVEKANEVLTELGCPDEGLCFSNISPILNKFQETVLTVGARTDSFYEYLLKQYLQTGEEQYLNAWNTSMELVREDMYKSMGHNKTYIVGEIELNGQLNPKMDHLACWLPGSLALSYMYGINRKHLEMAENIAETCWKMYRTPTGLAPEIVYWKGRKMTAKKYDKFSLLRPEAVESFFYLYQVTRNEKYRDWSWKIFESIQKYAKVPTGGYSSIRNVFRTEKIERIDRMESFFLAETLKYLYLTMADETIFSLTRWVFNTEAHPLPIYEKKLVFDF